MGCVCEERGAWRGLSSLAIRVWMEKFWLCSLEGTGRQVDTWPSSLFCRLHQSVLAHPHLGVGFWLWLGVALGPSQGQGKDVGGEGL